MPNQGAACPSCGRFVGPLEKCPYCGADIHKRIPLRFLALACLVLAILGVAILVYAVSGAPTPTTKIRAVGATMNYAYVRLDGTVTRGPIYDAAAQSLHIYIADDTGEIQAAAFHDVTSQLIAQNKIPTIGDKISVDGTLRIRDDLSSLTLVSADKLHLTPPDPVETKIGDIGRADESRLVSVSGYVLNRSQPYPGLTLVTLGDASGELDVAVSSDIEKLYGALPAVELGAAVQVRGIVSYYRDQPQLVLRHPQDLQKLNLSNDPLIVSQISLLDSSRVNQQVQVSGKVTRVSKFSQGERATLTDDTGDITLVLWQNVFDQLANASDLKGGAQVTALGTLTEYRGELEVQPHQANDITILPYTAAKAETPSSDTTQTVSGAAQSHPTRTPTAAPVVRAISGLTETDKDVTVIVQGKIARASPFSQGTRYTLDDNSGTLTLLLWSDLLAKISNRAGLNRGAVVRVTGKIDVFNNALEIVPKTADNVKVVNAALIPSVRTIKSISTADLDQSVLVQGTITDLADFSAGKNVTVQDDTGEIRVTVFTNILTPIKSKLVVGAKISAQGKVNVFQGKMEIVADEIKIE